MKHALFVVVLGLSLGASRAEAAPPKEARLAKKVVRAVASKDYAQLEKLMSPEARKELSDIAAGNFRELVQRLETEKIDLKKARVEKVVPTPGFGMTGVEVHLVHEKRKFMMHFTIMTLTRPWSITGVARWIKDL